MYEVILASGSDSIVLANGSDGIALANHAKVPGLMPIHTLFKFFLFYLHLNLPSWGLKKLISTFQLQDCLPLCVYASDFRGSQKLYLCIAL